MPSSPPPRGFEYMLKKYYENNFMPIIHTFGFGYNLEVDTLQRFQILLMVHTHLFQMQEW